MATNGRGVGRGNRQEGTGRTGTSAFSAYLTGNGGEPSFCCLNRPGSPAAKKHNARAHPQQVFSRLHLGGARVTPKNTKYIPASVDPQCPAADGVEAVRHVSRLELNV